MLRKRGTSRLPRHAEVQLLHGASDGGCPVLVQVPQSALDPFRVHCRVDHLQAPRTGLCERCPSFQQGPVKCEIEAIAVGCSGILIHWNCCLRSSALPSNRRADQAIGNIDREADPING